ncbi:MAG TPA: hypothetical protein VD839_01520 [Burkholderiales bacterium]|jgi:hypothetical protein|nr:hypothetical protein [Burkholderiales bacterium]
MAAEATWREIAGLAPIPDFGRDYVGKEPHPKCRPPRRGREQSQTLEALLLGTKIIDPAGEYYDHYYAVYFLDPDGLKLEGYGQVGTLTPACPSAREAAVVIFALSKTQDADVP